MTKGAMEHIVRAAGLLDAQKIPVVHSPVFCSNGNVMCRCGLWYAEGTHCDATIH
jgi:hypothetical protein